MQVEGEHSIEVQHLWIYVNRSEDKNIQIYFHARKNEIVILELQNGRAPGYAAVDAVMSHRLEARFPDAERSTGQSRTGPRYQ